MRGALALLLALVGGFAPTPEARIAGGAGEPADALAQDGDGADPAAQDEDAHELPPPLPQRPVDGLSGVHVRSRLVPDGAREAPVALTFTHVFPDRSRLNHEPVGGGPLDARRWMRAGPRAWLMDPREKASQELAGDALARELLRLEARRALFLWPHGLAWSRDDAASRATAELTRAGDVDEALGTLAVTLDADGLPAHLSATRPDGYEVVSLAVDTRDARGRPELLTVALDGAVVGRETVLSITTNLLYHDTYFVPPDRRERGKLGRQLWQALDLRPSSWKRVELPAGLDWSQARARREELAAKAAAELDGGPHRVTALPAFELDWTGRPTAVLLRLEQATDDPPQGWTTQPERPGVTLVLTRLDQLDTARLGVLRGGVPEDAEPGRPYVLLPGSGPFEAQVFLSYEHQED